MEDLLQSQIRESCRLALPEGLKDLMSDISREVLREQPPDLYNFIVDYLSALLLARETLSISTRVCCELCKGSCQPELENELRNIGLEGEELETTRNVVMEYFDKGEVNEGNLLMKLLRKTSIAEDMLPAVQCAVRAAFMKHHREHQAKLKEEQVEETLDRGEVAARHTFKLYDKKNEAQDKAAKKIQATVRGYLVRSHQKDSIETLKEKVAQVKIHDEPAKREPKASTSRMRGGMGRLSSTSLAGSMINLPKYVPYSAHDLSYSEFEEHETERNNIDYTLDSNYRDHKPTDGKKFEFHQHHTLYQIESQSIKTEEYEEEEEEEEEMEEEKKEESEIEEIDSEVKDDGVEEDIVEADTESKSSTVDENITEEKSLVDEIERKLASPIDEAVDCLVDTTNKLIEVERSNIIYDNISSESDNENEQCEPKSGEETITESKVKDELLIPPDNVMTATNSLQTVKNRPSPKKLSFIDENLNIDQLKLIEPNMLAQEVANIVTKRDDDRIIITVQDPELEYIDVSSPETTDHPDSKPTDRVTTARRSNMSRDHIAVTNTRPGYDISNKSSSDDGEIEIMSNILE